MNLAQPAVPKQVAQKLVEVAESTLAEALGREPDAKEIAELAEGMVAELLSGAFIMLREHGEGPAAAEEWLRKTLAMAAAGVRLRGSEAFIKIEVSIRDVPNRIAPKQAEPAKEPVAQAPPCACSKEPDGSCPSCVEKLADTYKRLFGFFREIGKLQGALKDTCKACHLDQLDRALSTSIETLFAASDRLAGDAKASFAHEILTVILQLAAAAGVREMPLTITAWKTAAEERGLLTQAQVPAPDTP